MYKKKSKLRSLKNYNLRKVSAETEIMNTLLKHISMKKTHGIERTSLCRSKISLLRIWDLLKSHEHKLKAWMRNLIGNSNKISTTISKNHYAKLNKLEPDRTKMTKQHKENKDIT